MSEVMSNVRKQFPIRTGQRCEEEEEITNAVNDYLINKSGNCVLLQIRLPNSHQDAG
jgi:hypothetical protein